MPLIFTVHDDESMTEKDREKSNEKVSYGTDNANANVSNYGNLLVTMVLVSWLLFLQS